MEYIGDCTDADSQLEFLALGIWESLVETALTYIEVEFHVIG
jgi:hypothetical protein